MKNKEKKAELWEITPCPYQPFKDGLVIVDLKQLIDGYKEGRYRAKVGAVEEFVLFLKEYAFTNNEYKFIDEWCKRYLEASEEGK